MGTLSSQEGDRLHAIRRHVQADGRVGFAEGFQRQANISGAILDEEDLYQGFVSQHHLDTPWVYGSRLSLCAADGPASVPS
jgi:hypothetical protein